MYSESRGRSITGKESAQDRELSGVGLCRVSRRKNRLPQTTKVGHEFGGFLYKNSNGRYSSSYPPVEGTPTTLPTLFSSPQALVSGIVGWFHDHPLVPGYNNDLFSGYDLLDTRKTGPGYLGTATGRILKLSIDPKGLPHVTDVDSGACQVQ